MTYPQQLRQKLLDLLIDVDAWTGEDETLREQLAAAREHAQRLENENLGATLRLETELSRSSAEATEKIADLEKHITALTNQVHAQNQEILDARRAFAKELETRPETLSELTRQALVLIQESKKILREHL